MTATSVGDLPGAFERFEEVFRELTATEERLAVTAGVVFAALVIGLVLLPLSVRVTARLVRSRFLPDGVVRGLELVEGYLPTTLSRLTLRMLQAVIGLAAGLAVLVTWGMVSTATTVVSTVWVTLPYAGQTVLSAVLLLGAYIVADVFGRTVREFGESASQLTDQQEEILLRMGHLAILLVTISGLLTLWGLDLSGLLVGAGVLGVVLGLAARQTVGAIIAGFVLMFTQPFTIGDWVEIGEYEGAVTQITIMHTTVREFDGELVVIPNDVVGEQAIRNLSHQDLLRLETEVGIDYESDPAHAEEVALDAIADLDEITDAPPPETATVALADSAVVVRLLYWIEDPTPIDRRQATRAVVHAVKARFEEEGIGMPFPQRTISGWPDEEGVAPFPSDRTE